MRIVRTCARMDYLVIYVSYNEVFNITALIAGGCIGNSETHY